MAQIILILHERSHWYLIPAHFLIFTLINPPIVFGVFVYEKFSNVSIHSLQRVTKTINKFSAIISNSMGVENKVEEKLNVRNPAYEKGIFLIR